MRGRTRSTSSMGSGGRQGVSSRCPKWKSPFTTRGEGADRAYRGVAPSARAPAREGGRGGRGMNPKDLGGDGKRKKPPVLASQMPMVLEVALQKAKAEAPNPLVSPLIDSLIPAMS